MNVFRQLTRRLVNLFRRGNTETEMAEEMRFHLDMRKEEKIEDGFSPEEASYAAQLKFGNIGAIQERAREVRGWVWVEQSLQDLSYATRQLTKSPGFTAIAVLTLGLGLGVNATMFTCIRDYVLRPVLRDQQLRLVSVHNQRDGGKSDFRYFSYAEFSALREPSDIFSDIAAIYFRFDAVGRPDDLRRRLTAVASENYFSLLGIQPIRGRFFSIEESRPEAAIPVLVANFGLWDRLGRPADFVGSTIRVNQRDYTVIGITPPGFGGVNVTIGPDVWLPLGEASQLAGENNFLSGATNLDIVGTLHSGISREVARRQLSALDRRINDLPGLHSDGPRRLLFASPSRMNIGNPAPSSEQFWPLFAALAMGLSAAVLVLACLNLANLLLARGASRHKEIAIRLSLGATRGRVVRQLLVEGLLLALLGSVFALLLSYASGTLLLKFSNEAFQMGMFSLSAFPFFDASIVAALGFFSLVATFAANLGPALRLTRLDLVHDLKQQSGDSPGTSRWNRFFAGRHCLLMGQIALSVTLLFSSGLFMRGSWRARTIDPGFQTRNQLVANIDYRLARLPVPEIARRQTALLARAASLPGVASVALASDVPYNFELPWEQVEAADGIGASAAQNETHPRLFAGHTTVSAGYFSTLGITFLRGRNFSEAECSLSDGPRVVIIDDTLASALFGDTEALGRRISIGDQASAKGDREQAWEVVGIVRSPRNEVFASNPPRRYYQPLGHARMENTYLHLRTLTPDAVLGMLRRELQSLDQNSPVLFVRPLASFVNQNINALLVDLAATIFGVFGGIALLLAVVGVYGVKAQAVARRTREISIRLALGARPIEIVALVVKQGVLQALVGLGLGLLLALLAGRILAQMLYQVDPADPFALAASAFTLGLAVIVACFLPARRATKVDPMVALRAE